MHTHVLVRCKIHCPGKSRRLKQEYEQNCCIDWQMRQRQYTLSYMSNAYINLCCLLVKVILTVSPISVPLPKPSCHQIYNLFYPCDVIALRLEPVVIEMFQHVAPIKIPRYQKFPLGDGSPLHVGK